jgi:hypothetical protein
MPLADPSTNLAGEQGGLKPQHRQGRGERQDGGIKLACGKQAAPTRHGVDRMPFADAFTNQAGEQGRTGATERGGLGPI